MDVPEDRPLLRIGELSRRLGISDHVLRAWESRYGLLQPVRSPGGFRLYSAADEARVRRMQAYLAGGLSAAEAARAVLDDRNLPSGAAPGGALDAAPPGGTDTRPSGGWDAAPPGGTDALLPGGPDAAPPGGTDALLPGGAGAQPGRSAGQVGSAALRRALDALDEPAAQAALDRLLAELTLPTVLRDVILPYLAELGERWRDGAATVTMEHFATNIIRGRLAGLARGWGSGHGPRALLACPPGEHHDMALMAFGIVLNRHGWRIDYLGPDTPIGELEQAAGAARPDLVVLAATLPETLETLRPQLAALARRAPLALAGAGGTAQLAREVGARLLAGDPVTEAERITASSEAVR